MTHEQNNLCGDWQALTGVLAGNDLPEEIVSATQLTFSENHYVVDLAGNIDRGDCEVRCDDELTKIKIEGKDGPNAGKTFFAILEFSTADEIRIAYDLSGTDYPNSFEPTSVSSNYVATFKRC